MARTPPPPPQPDEAASDDSDVGSDDQTNPLEVIEPVARLIHRNLGEVEWRVYSNHQMCYIFDCVTPGRQWKRHTVYSEDDPWAEYGPAPWLDLTETEAEPPAKPQQPYYPIDHSRKHKFAFDNFKSNDFLRWETGEVCELKVGVNRKVRNKNEYALRWKKLKVPLIYVQLVAQLVAEDLHGGHNTGHEALRRQSYARRLLDHVGNEFRTEFNKWKKFFKPCDIRFKTLNPVLQRYFRGVPDGYTPSVRSAISGSDRPTIRDVTMFYLAVDPCDPDLVPCYRRNLLYIPESRWHLAVILGIARLDSVEHFDRVRVNHDNIMEELALEGATDTADGEESKLNEVEVRAILDEGLEDFFKDQLNRVLEIVEQVKAQRAEEAEQDEEQDELEPMEV